MTQLYHTQACIQRSISFFKEACTPVSSCRDACTSVFRLLCLLFIIVCRKQNPPRYLATDEWISKTWYIYTKEFCIAVKKNEIRKFANKWLKEEKNITKRDNLDHKKGTLPVPSPNVDPSFKASVTCVYADYLQNQELEGSTGGRQFPQGRKNGQKWKQRGECQETGGLCKTVRMEETRAGSDPP